MVEVEVKMRTSRDAVKPLKMALLDSRRCEPGRPREQAPLPKKKEGICGPSTELVHPTPVSALDAPCSVSIKANHA
jgi:hypothetical protein